MQVAAVQTCRGSHTHTLLKSPSDDANLYVYVSGTAGVRPTVELPSCGTPAPTDPNSSFWRIEVIRVPLAAPQNAAVVEQATALRRSGDWRVSTGSRTRRRRRSTRPG